jgi:NAD(P)-dependent dehydrogenase (short-subunit alcohol dehydrogenase family)
VPRGHVLLVGGGGGVGSAAADLLLSRGYAVTVTLSSDDKAVQFLADRPQCRAFALDIADSSRVFASLSDKAAEVGPLDAVVVCAAVAPFGPAETVPLERMRGALEINCLSNLAIYQATMPLLRESRGRMVLTSSYSGRVATPMMTPYVASKFALECTADVMRQEASQWGVKVILLQPGAVRTRMMERSAQTLEQLIGMLPEREDQLYGAMYRKMLDRTMRALSDGQAIAARTVADAIVQALEAAEPASRYPVGPDADYLLRAARERPDAEIDAIVMEMYRE